MRWLKKLFGRKKKPEPARNEEQRLWIAAPDHIMCRCIIDHVHELGANIPARPLAQYSMQDRVRILQHEKTDLLCKVAYEQAKNERLKKELNAALVAKDNAVLQAQCWSQEAITQEATVYEIYKAFGITGKGSWNGARLVKEQIKILMMQMRFAYARPSFVLTQHEFEEGIQEIYEHLPAGVYFEGHIDGGVEQVHFNSGHVDENGKLAFYKVQR